MLHCDSLHLCSFSLTDFWGFCDCTYRVLLQDALDEQCPIHLQIRMNNNPFTTNGHDLFNFGYASGTDGTQYLFVMDGWNTYGRFVKYSYYPVVKGYKIWVNSN